MSGAAQGEIEKFNRMAERWWDPAGPMRPLHEMQPVRLGFIADQLRTAGIWRNERSRQALAGRRALDAGCGAGLLSEPLARLGAAVVGLDLSAEALEAARAHAEAAGLEIDYRETPIAAVAAAVRDGREAAFDLVVASEVLEHVADRSGFLRAAADALRPGGVLVATTLARTAASLVGGVLVAEYALGWLPRGTHDWRKFVSPDRLAREMAAAGLAVVDRQGLVYDPFGRRWTRSETNLSINYAMAAQKPG